MGWYEDLAEETIRSGPARRRRKEVFYFDTYNLDVAGPYITYEAAMEAKPDLPSAGNTWRIRHDEFWRFERLIEVAQAYKKKAIETGWNPGPEYR